MKQALPVILAVAATAAAAEDNRELGAHEHGVGTLNIAFEGTTVAMEFVAPGADIVGFEFVAESEIDRATVDAAVAALARPLELFRLPVDAACSVTQASAELELEDDHDDHGEEHAEAEDHDDHDHEEHAAEASHTEFHATYTLNCAEPAAITEITFAYFDTFPNALEIDVQVLTAAGAQAFEVARDAPTLSLVGAF